MSNTHSAPKVGDSRRNWVSRIFEARNDVEVMTSSTCLKGNFHSAVYRYHSPPLTQFKLILTVHGVPALPQKKSFEVFWRSNLFSVFPPFLGLGFERLLVELLPVKLQPQDTSIHYSSELLDSCNIHRIENLDNLSCRIAFTMVIILIAKFSRFTPTASALSLLEVPSDE